VDPVVIGRTLQRFSGTDRFVKLLLFLPEVIGDLQGVFSLDSITLALLFSLLLMGDLRGFHKILLRMLDWTEHAFVLLKSLALKDGMEMVLELTIDTCGFLSFEHISHTHLLGLRFSPTTP
jgi:hypothetical protein